MTDPIADMLTRIRNAQAVNKSEVVLPYSKLKHALGEILVTEKYISSVKKISADSTGLGTASRFDRLQLGLKYKSPKSPAITNLKRVSTPGRRVYVSKDKLPRVLNGMGIAIISTPQGLMTARQAYLSKIGGEVMCEIY
ncbi:30S ribosomal protein S8 [bacterium]|nr:30S ribosomal protein S8 [bacterium]|tara:strand:- start:24 stop:440 length:417 start_codon:yes stop_codon:yes gene_type:complete